MVYVVNAFSVAMLGNDRKSQLKIEKIKISEAREIVEKNKDTLVTFISRRGVAKSVSNLLNIPVSMERRDIYIHKGDTLLLARIPQKIKTPMNTTESKMQPDGLEFHKITLK